MCFVEHPANPDSIAAAVKELMHRKGVPERRLSRKLAEVLNLSYSQAHRKLNGGVDWTIGQLKVVAEYFGESLAAIGLGDGGEDGPGAGREEMREAMLIVGHGQFSYPCLVWVGEQLHAIGKADFVALPEEGGWRVVEAQQCPENVARHKVNKLEIALRRQAAPTVAVVDDEAGFADNLGEYLNESGFRASTFYSSAALERELPERAFDGYIIDWTLGDRTAEALIKRIRESANPLAPVFLLTGELGAGVMEESELARVILQLDVQWREKPIRLATFSAELQRALGHDLSTA
jgi:CheY-like chemotaxis protein